MSDPRKDLPLYAVNRDRWLGENPGKTAADYDAYREERDKKRYQKEVADAEYQAYRIYVDAMAWGRFLVRWVGAAALIVLALRVCLPGLSLIGAIAVAYLFLFALKLRGV